MENLWTLLKSLAPVLYGGIGLLLLITLGQAWRAYRRLIRAFFRVEREMAAMDLLSGLTRAAFLLVLGLGLWLLVGSGVLSPLSEPSPLPTPARVPSPTVPGLRSPTPRISPSPGFLPIPSPSPLPLPSPSPIPSPSPSPTATPTPLRARCPDPNAQIEFPSPGQVISQPITLIGTATHSAFQFYKVEIHGPYTGGQWVTLGDIVRQPVIEGRLWTFDPRPFFPQPGRYRLRVVVVDIAAREVAICEVPVVIAPPGSG
ncbi:hypothetical protein [Thermoflexus sp.]|uniref:hypothetical protein n=1 Tax=Thermoflexus sp. TaxID=1969742 RepID=UPI002ADE480D|nr:hypothetical protein [Thermoflexus sp.]